jgi:hypothetical protein
MLSFLLSFLYFKNIYCIWSCVTLFSFLHKQTSLLNWACILKRKSTLYLNHARTLFINKYLRRDWNKKKTGAGKLSSTRYDKQEQYC